MGSEIQATFWELFGVAQPAILEIPKIKLHPSRRVQSGCHISWGEPSPVSPSDSIVKSFTMCQFLAAFGNSFGVFSKEIATNPVCLYFRKLPVGPRGAFSSNEHRDYSKAGAKAKRQWSVTAAIDSG